MNPDDGTGYFTRRQWFTLPLKFRQRWWAETDFGRRQPSWELLQTAIAYIDKPLAPTRNAPISEAKP